MRTSFMALLVVLLLAASAHALTLTITSGSAGGVQQAGPVCLEPDVSVSGANFTLTGFGGTTFCPDLNVDMLFTGTLTLNGVTTGGCNPNCVNNTIFSFTSKPFTEPTPLIPLSAYHGPYLTTFTMTGHTNLGGPGGFDFFGEGVMVLGRIVTEEFRAFQRFDFRVAEHSSLALVTAALATMLVAHRRWRTKQR